MRDLGSTNGTHARGERLAANERAFLQVGAVLVFGGDDERWTLEVDGNTRVAVDHERIHAQGIWTLRIPPSEGERVPTTASIADITKLAGPPVLRFEVSRDEEYIAVSLVCGSEVTRLGDHTHHKVLLHAP